jgi:peroxiredoxin
MVVTLQGPHEGTLLPDFTMYFRDGRTLYRRELKGRSHAVIVFLPEYRPGEASALLRAIDAHLPAWQAARAAVLVVLTAARADETESLSFEPVLDRDGTLRARFGVGPCGALFVADRYGEIVLRVDGAAADGDASALSLDEVTPTLELLEIRCSL